MWLKSNKHQAPILQNHPTISQHELPPTPFNFSILLPVCHYIILALLVYLLKYKIHWNKICGWCLSYTFEWENVKRAQYNRSTFDLQYKPFSKIKQLKTKLIRQSMLASMRHKVREPCENQPHPLCQQVCWITAFCIAWGRMQDSPFPLEKPQHQLLSLVDPFGKRLQSPHPLLTLGASQQLCTFPWLVLKQEATLN